MRRYEFALTRDPQTGQLVESGSGGSATALKVGAGVALAGGAGYGGYKAHQAIMGKYAPKAQAAFVNANYGNHLNPMNGSMPTDWAKAQAAKDFTTAGNIAKTRATYSAAAQSGLASGKRTLRGGLLKAARWFSARDSLKPKLRELAARSEQARTGFSALF